MDRLKSVTLSGFSAHVRNMHQDRDKGFEHEYQVRLNCHVILFQCCFSNSFVSFSISPLAMTH